MLTQDYIMAKLQYKLNIKRELLFQSFQMASFILRLISLASCLFMSMTCLIITCLPMNSRHSCAAFPPITFLKAAQQDPCLLKVHWKF